MKSALSNPGFVKIWTGQLISQIGDKFYAIALAVWIADGRGTPLVMAAFLIASMVPGLLMGPAAGALADRRSRKAVLIAADLVRAAVVAGVSILYAAGLLQVWEVMTAAAAISAASAFFNPALSAALPGVVGEEALGEANSLSQIGGGATMVLGPACGALVLGFLGYEAVFLFNAVSFLASAALIAFTRIPRAGRGAAGAGIGESIAEGLRFMRKNRAIVSKLAVVALAHLFVGGLSVALPFLARSIGGSSAVNLGFLEALMGAGMVGGSVAVSRVAGKLGDRSPSAVLSAAGGGICAMGILEAAGVAPIAPFLAFAAVIGASIAVAAAAWTTGLQRNTPDALRGRVFGFSTMLGNASLPVGMALAGLALDRVRICYFLMPWGGLAVLAGLLLILAQLGGKMIANGGRAEKG